MISSPQFPVEIEHIRKHYDRLSYLYRLFWGEHLHHGYWENNESVPRAQIQLMERLAERAGIPGALACSISAQAWADRRCGFRNTSTATLAV